MQVKNKYTYRQLLRVQLVLLPKSTKTSKTHQEPKRISLQKLKLSGAGEERKGSPAKRGAGSWLSSPTCFGLSQPGERSLSVRQLFVKYFSLCTWHFLLLWSWGLCKMAALEERPSLPLLPAFEDHWLPFLCIKIINWHTGHSKKWPGQRCWSRSQLYFVALLNCRETLWVPEGSWDVYQGKGWSSWWLDKFGISSQKQKTTSRLFPHFWQNPQTAYQKQKFVNQTCSAKYLVTEWICLHKMFYRRQDYT